MTAVSDNFTNTDDTDITAHDAGGIDWVKFKSADVATIQGNKVEFGNDGGNQASMILTGRVFTTDDQWAQMSYDTATGIAGPAVRCAITGDAEAGGGSGHGYVLRVFSTSWQLWQINSTGSLVNLMANGSGIATTGTARIEANGDNITATINGSEVANVTDTGITAGRRAGITFTTGTAEADDFSASDANVTTATAYEFTGPEIGQVNVASTNFTLSPSGGDWPSGQSIAVTSDGTGTFSPAGPYSPTGSDSVTLTYTPTSKTGSPHTITAAATPALGTDPTPIDYAVVDYSTVTATSPNGEAITVLVPSNYSATSGANIVLYCHGNNGTNEEMGSRTVAEQAAWIDALIDEGYLLAASNMSGNNWGNDDALADLVDLYSYCVTNYRLKDTLIWSASMGGLPGLLAIDDDRIPRVKGWLGIVPVCNLADMFDSNSGTFAATIRTAYGIAADGSDYSAQTSGHDPALLSASRFTDVGFMFIASSGDTTVDKTQNADVMHALVQSEAFESSIVEHTGNHGDSTRYGVAVPDGINFYARCLANTGGSGTGVGTNTPEWALLQQVATDAGLELKL